MGGGGGTVVARGEGRDERSSVGFCFQMPVHYPRYSRLDYEVMPEWKLDRLLGQYGLQVAGSIEQKRTFAMGAFLWAQP